LITRRRALRAGSPQIEKTTAEQTMMDLMYVGVLAGFFLIAGWYVRACEKL
jgi:hypothetical protein